MRRFTLSLLLAGASLCTPAAMAQKASSQDIAVPAADPLLSAFREPPASARPRVWWHWLSGNVSQDGITKDLEWMKRIGVAGAMMFDGDMGAPRIVPERVTVLSKPWYHDLRFAASEADRLGLEFAMAAAPGWSETGGPWVKPEWGMKKFVWSETRLTGGRRAGRLAPLPDTAGPFQAMRKRDFAGKALPGLSLARDIAVLAFRAPDGDVPLAALAPTLSASAPGLPLGKLIDGRLDEPAVLPAPTDAAPTWVRYDFAVPQTMRALTYVGPLGGRFAEGPTGRIEASEDGQTWRSIRTLVGQAHNPAPQRTFAFPETTARHFRIVFDRATVSREPWPQRPNIPVVELALVPGARVDLFEDRAGFGVLAQADAVETPAVAPRALVRSADVLDLSDKLQPDGTLDWTPPAGRWIVLRTGWSLTGEVNHPATPEGTGLEVDKLNATHVRAHLDAYMTPVVRELGDGLVGKRGLGYLLTDSWEAGQENWTEMMPDEFRKRRGYDLTHMLPVLAGFVVDSSDRSDAFLWDFRRTLADLVADNHYGTITRFAAEHRLGYYGEATGAAWPTVADGMLAKSQTDIPMGEFWAMPFGGQPAAYHGVRSDEFPADVIETRSTAHVYGKPLVAAEALTSSLPQWTSTPWSLKWVVDKYMAMGINRLVLHTSPHQPDDTHKPGLALGPYGQVFTRHETWGEMAKPWIDYLSRSSFLLQQGLPVADVLYFYGEGAPSGVPYDIASEPADLTRWGFDYVNADALMRLAKTEDGSICFPGGASYRLLVLPRGLTRITLPMITHLRDLVAAGAILVGPKPTGSPSLSSDSGAVRTIADQLWGQTDGRSLTVHPFGKGRVYWRDEITDVLAAEGIAPDFEASPANPAMDLRFAHRRLADGDVYFVTNQSPVAATVPVRFRVSGKAPEAWDPADGESRPLSYHIAGGTTEVPLTLGAFDSTFVMFRRPATASDRAVSAPTERTLMTMAGGWTLSIPATEGVPIQMPTTTGSWTSDERPDVRYFSGVATYTRSFDFRALPKRGRLYLEMGEVGDVAEVRVNGVLAGTAWKPPYRVNVSGHLRAGGNKLEIRVANTWQNRLVGDQQPGAIKRAWTNASRGGPGLRGAGITAGTPLTRSGLLDPVRLILVE
jgi:hypothetical protein